MLPRAVSLFVHRNSQRSVAMTIGLSDATRSAPAPRLPIRRRGGALTFTLLLVIALFELLRGPRRRSRRF